MKLAWCPKCREFSVLDAGRPCAWCDSTLVKKRGGWTRPDKAAESRVTRSHALAIHVAHCQGLSLREISRRVWERLGYSSPDSCLEGIRTALAREGLSVRPQDAATAAANRARGKRLPGEDKNAYKRRQRREVGYRDTRTGEWRKAA